MLSRSQKSSESFADIVYSVVKQIPKGKVLTYREVANLAGKPKACRAVGNILSKNKDPETVPCHRVIRSDGFCGKYAFGGVLEKIAKLREEGIRVDEMGRVVTNS